MKEKDFKKEVCRLLQYGIEEYGTRNDSQLKLIFHFWSLGYTREQTIEAIEKWLHSFNHRSKTWQTNRQGAIKNAGSAVNSFYRNRETRGKKPVKPHVKQLTIADVENILALTREYRLGKFIFYFLQHCKNNKAWKNELRIPRTLIVKLPCCSMESYLGKMDFCKKMGLIEIKRQHSREEHRARTYKVNFQFNEYSDPVSSFDEALTRIFSQKELQRYSRRTYEKYLRPILLLSSGSCTF